MPYLTGTPVFTLQNSSHFEGAQKKKIGFVTKEGDIDCYGETKLARLQPNFNYVLTLEMTLKAGSDGNTVL